MDLDCNSTFPINLTTNTILFGGRSGVQTKALCSLHVQPACAASTAAHRGGRVIATGLEGMVFHIEWVILNSRFASDAPSNYFFDPTEQVIENIILDLNEFKLFVPTHDGGKIGVN